MLVLQLLSEKDLYGYEITKNIMLLSDGMFQMKQGTLYPILHSLEDNEYIVSYWEDSASKRKRKYYHITDQGRKQLEAKKNEWCSYVESVVAVLGELEWKKN